MKMLFVGDVMLGRLVNRALKRKPPEFPWGDTLRVFNEADLRICNLECVISDRGEPWSATPKVFHFRTDAKNIEVLKTARIDAVALANNHILDFEYEAMADTFAVLDGAGIRHAGAGPDIRTAMEPAVVEKGGGRVALVSFTDNEPDWEATEERPGVFYAPIDLEDKRAGKLLDLVRMTKGKGLFTVVSAHWGPNWGYRPVERHMPFAHALVDAGADVVFGHSCHVFQGIETYKGSAIIYSAGDFVDDYAVDEIERNDESFIFVAEADKGRVARLLLYPTVIDNFSASLAKGPRASHIASKMMKLCHEMNTRARWNEGEKRLDIPIG